jgi:hypothetical protein
MEQFAVGNGKVLPSYYGSDVLHDFGLCFSTFLTRKCCEIGLNCPWRHHPLSNDEKSWIMENNKERGKEFAGKANRFWAFPEVPLPGARLHGKGGWDA